MRFPELAPGAGLRARPRGASQAESGVHIPRDGSGRRRRCVSQARGPTLGSGYV